MSVSEIMAEIMKLFDFLGMSTFIQAFLIIGLAVSLLRRIFGSGD